MKTTLRERIRGLSNKQKREIVKALIERTGTTRQNVHENILNMPLEKLQLQHLQALETQKIFTEDLLKESESLATILSNK